MCQWHSKQRLLLGITKVTLYHGGRYREDTAMLEEGHYNELDINRGIIKENCVKQNAWQ